MVFLPLSVLAAHSGLLTLLGYVPVIRNNPSSSLNNIIYSSKTSLKKKAKNTHTTKKPPRGAQNLALGPERKHFGAKCLVLSVIFLFLSDKKIQMLSKITLNLKLFFLNGKLGMLTRPDHVNKYIPCSNRLMVS